MPKLPSNVLNYFKKQGKKGGKAAAEGMTAEERTARAKKAAAASAKVRAKKNQGS
jgi:hypothetical protein